MGDRPGGGLRRSGKISLSKGHIRLQARHLKVGPVWTILLIVLLLLLLLPLPLPLPLLLSCCHLKCAVLPSQRFLLFRQSTLETLLTACRARPSCCR